MTRSIWTSLLFLHGYVVDPSLARQLTEDLAEDSLPTAESPEAPGEAVRRALALGRRWSLRLCQGIGSGLVHMQ